MVATVIETDMGFSGFLIGSRSGLSACENDQFLGSGFHSRAGFFAQQACEKYLKALLVQYEKSYAETHQLLHLAGICEGYDRYFGEPETKRILEQFDMFDQIGRYGGAAKFDPLSKGKAVGGVMLSRGEGVQISGAFVWTDKHLQDLDSFVFNSRSRLDFSAVKFDDSLKSILDRNRRSILVGTWQGKQPIRVVLTKKNAYFKP